MTKEEIMKQMRFHQAEYSKLNEEYKTLKAQEDQEHFVSKQLARLEEFSAKYKFFLGDEGAPVAIDWEDVSKSIKSTVSMEEGYALGWDETGVACLIKSTYNNVVLTGLFEEESDIRKYLEREAKRKEVAARKK